VALVVVKGTPIQIALDQELRLHKPGQTVHAVVVEPVYAFDKLVLPVGTQVLGEVKTIERIPKGKRTAAALNADFTPSRKVEMEFNQLILTDGRRVELHANITPGSGQVLQFTAAREKKRTVKDAASEKVSAARQQAKQQWDSAMQQVKSPGRLHRLERFAQSQLPVHPQYIPAGAVYFAELNDPLDFGSEILSPEIAASMGGTFPPGSVVHARLVTPLDSATTQRNENVEAVLSQPLFEAGHLILPQGSRLKGTVLQARPARRLKRNGQLRVTFHELIYPDGVGQKVQATLQAVEAAKNGNVQLDSEGGAEATTPKSRYLTTALSIGLAAASGGDSDRGKIGGDAGGDASSRAAGGLGGFKLVGLALGVAVHSRAFGSAMGAYGAGMSVYSNFLARGREVVFPKNMAMAIDVGQRAEESPAGLP
jgi:type IV secretory pathway VirB10-like protein